MFPRPEARRPGWNSSDSFVGRGDRRLCRHGAGYGMGSGLDPALWSAHSLAWVSTNHHAVNGPCLLLGSLTNLSREIVLTDSELFVHVNQFLAGVLQEETAGQQKKRRQQIAEEHESVEANGPAAIVEDCLPIRNQEFEAVHQ